MTAHQQKRPGAMRLRALEAQAAQAPGVTPTRKSLRDYLAGPQRVPTGPKAPGDERDPPTP